MTLIKGILVGSAAGSSRSPAHRRPIFDPEGGAGASCQDCNVAGITGWTLPGSDTCVKLSGYITAQIEGGNLQTQYNYGSIGDAATAAANPLIPQSPAVARLWRAFPV